jgi:hypothetical protein
MCNSPAIHFKVIVVSSPGRRAIFTFFGSPLRRRRNSDSVGCGSHGVGDWDYWIVPADSTYPFFNFSPMSFSVSRFAFAPSARVLD